jgi:hypothetical protein
LGHVHWARDEREGIEIGALTPHLRNRLKVETVRRYVGDLKRFGVIVQEGRGPFRSFG